VSLSLQGHTILIVDEVDDTRKTLAYAVEELLKDIEAERHQWEAANAVPRTHTPPQPSCSGSSSPLQELQAEEAQEWQAPRLGVFVVHNKLKQKKAELPEWLMKSSYFTAGDIQDNWVSP
jgi:hypoxanthine phosphoribosyltransferase